MSLSDIRSECAGIAGLLQPYVDGELSSEEQERVAEHLDECRGCRAAVTEQAWVRAALRALPREPAPQAVRARVLLALDDVDRERAAEARTAAAAEARPGLWSRMWSRLSDLGRGGLIMVPAGAAAVGLFFVVKDATVPTPDPVHAAAPLGIGGALSPGAQSPTTAEPDDDPTSALADLEPEVGFQPQMPGPDRQSQSVQLVGAGIDDSEHNAARLRFEVLSGGRPTGHHLIDRQVPADGLKLRGDPVLVGGRPFHIERDAGGTAMVHFVVGSVGHTVRLEGTMGRIDGHDVVDDTGRRAPADVAALLRFALGFDG